MTLDELKQKNRNIVFNIARAEEQKDAVAIIALKRDLYQNKIKILDLLTTKNESLTTTARQLKAKVDSMPHAVRYETGISVLDDELNGGFEVGSLIQLAGQSFAGKTTLFLQVVANISKYSKAVFFSFEMGDRRIVKRLTYLLKEDQQWDNMMMNGETRNIDDLVMEITLLADDGIKFFAIDSRMKLNKISSDAEYLKIAAISKALSECAIKNDIIILMINQISESDLQSGRLAFKGAGDQMYDSDMALFITVDEDGTRNLICTKSRQDETTFKIQLPKDYEQSHTVEVIEFKETVNAGYVL